MDHMIHLRKMTDEDTEKIIRWRNQEFVLKNFIDQEPLTKEKHHKWTKQWVETGRVVQFIICLSDGREIGTVYLRDIDRESGDAEYGIFIGEEDATGRGYGTETAKEVLTYAFSELGLNRVFLRYLADNTAAQASYSRAGFRMIYNKKEIKKIRGSEREVCFMEIYRDEWKKVNEENK